MKLTNQYEQYLRSKTHTGTETHTMGFEACNPCELGTAFKEVDRLRAICNETLNYLSWNEDALGGDDLVGDGRLTKRFQEIVGKLSGSLYAPERAIDIGTVTDSKGADHKRE